MVTIKLPNLFIRIQFISMQIDCPTYVALFGDDKLFVSEFRNKFK